MSAAEEDDLCYDPDDPFFGYVKGRVLPDGTMIAVMRAAFNSRLVIGDAWHWKAGWDRAYCYATSRQSLEALEKFEGGEPLDGWHRSIHDMRRRPDGDPTKEYIAP